MCRLLAAEPPWWEPGTGHGEHALFYGHICGELVRRADGRSLGTFWREEVAVPWALDFHIGLGRRRARPHRRPRGRARRPATVIYAASRSTNPPGLLELSVVNGDAWRAAEIPAVNGHGTAAAVARFYAGLLGGGELDGVRLGLAGHGRGDDRGELTARDVVLDEEITWGLGVWVDDDGFGMGGLGGSLGMADPALGVAEAYVTRHLAGHERAEADGRRLTLGLA